MTKKVTPPPEYVRRMADQERSDYDPIKQSASMRKLLEGRFGDTLRKMIREWWQLHPPTGPHNILPPALRPPAVRRKGH